eukprot:m51a1_g2444 putative ubiquitin-conjugating enzyme e2 g2 (183) ;mRNA; r:868847-869933
MLKAKGTASGVALKRLMQEYKRMTEDPPPGVAAGPVDEGNYFLWEAVIMGPDDTDYAGGAFTATLAFPPDYPLSPPKMRFTCPMWHPNIYPNGDVCISILHAPGADPMHYESAAERWSPVQSIEKILISVVSMLAEPNDESPANIDAAKMWRSNREAYKRRVRQTVEASLNLAGQSAAPQKH